MTSTTQIADDPITATYRNSMFKLLTGFEQFIGNVIDPSLSDEMTTMTNQLKAELAALRQQVAIAPLDKLREINSTTTRRIYEVIGKYAEISDNDELLEKLQAIKEGNYDIVHSHEGKPRYH